MPADVVTLKELDDGRVIVSVLMTTGDHLYQLRSGDNVEAEAASLHELVEVADLPAHLTDNH